MKTTPTAHKMVEWSEAMKHHDRLYGVSLSKRKKAMVWLFKSRKSDSRAVADGIRRAGA